MKIKLSHGVLYHVKLNHMFIYKLMIQLLNMFELHEGIQNNYVYE